MRASAPADEIELRKRHAATENLRVEENKVVIESKPATLSNKA